MIDSIVGENIPVLTEEEKYNETVQSSVTRVVAKLSGTADPGPPARCVCWWGGAKGVGGLETDARSRDPSTIHTHARLPTASLAGVCRSASAPTRPRQRQSRRRE